MGTVQVTGQQGQGAGAVGRSGFCYAFEDGFTGADGTDKFKQLCNDLSLTHGRKGACVKMPHASRLYLRPGEVVIPPGISIISDFTKLPFSEGTSEMVGPAITFAVTSGQMVNAPLLQNMVDVLPRVYVRGGGDKPDGSFGGAEDGLNQVYSCSGVYGINLISSLDVTTHTMDADLIRLHRAWNFVVFGCNLWKAPFAVRALDCNVLRVEHNNFIHASGFFSSLADSRVDRNDQFNGNGRCAASFWFTESACHKNIITDNLMGNNQSNGYVRHPLREHSPMLPILAVDSETGIITLGEYEQFASLDLGHLWTTGTPVCFDIVRWPARVGSVPTGITESGTYYVDRIDKNRIRVARSRRDLRLGNFVKPTDAGVSCYMNCGKEATLYVNDGANSNRFGGGRFDQARGASVMFDGAPNNQLSGGHVLEGSFGNYTNANSADGFKFAQEVAQPAIQLINGSTGIVLGGGLIIDGKKAGAYGSEGKESRQKYGIYRDESSKAQGKISHSVQLVNHDAAGSEAGADDFYDYRDNPNRKFVWAERMKKPAASTAAEDVSNDGREYVWRIPNAVDTFLMFHEEFEADWKHIDVYLHYENPNASTGNVFMSVFLGKYAPGENNNSGTANEHNVDAVLTAGAKDVMQRAFIGQFTNTGRGGYPLRGRLKRTGSHAVNDTLENDILVTAIEFVRRW